MVRPKKADTATAAAFSYTRFSSPEQAKGDSLRRQTDPKGAAAWCERNGVTLDTSLTLQDKGVSAFTGEHRKNPDRHALAAFLKLVRDGRIPRGSYLIVENLDRLTREHIRPALTLLLNLIDQGIRIVQLLPVEQVYDDRVEPMHLVIAIMELSRGHSESRMKSERVGAAWRAKKLRAAADGEPLTRRVPGWLRVEGGKFVVAKRNAEVVRRIYRLATEGHGIGVITRRLNAEGVPPIGRAKKWARSYVAKILTTRAVFGEYQPHKGHAGPNRKPDGPPIPNYYPAIVTEQQWYAARAAMTSRREKPGRIGRSVNLFAGLLRDARDGGSMQRLDKGEKSSGPAYVPYHAVQGVPGAVYVSFPVWVFEKAVLSRLREIDPPEVLPPEDGKTDEVLALTGKLADLEGRVEKLKAKLADGDEIDALVDVLRKVDTERRATADELARAKREAANPLSEAWGECHSLLDALAASPDPEAGRTRLRAALRAVVTEIRCLFVAKGRDRLAVVQIWFEGGAHRDYLIYHRPAHGSLSSKRDAQWWVRSFAMPGRKGELDLRDPKQATALEKALANAEVPADESVPPTRRRGKRG